MRAAFYQSTRLGPNGLAAVLLSFYPQPQEQGGAACPSQRLHPA